MNEASLLLSRYMAWRKGFADGAGTGRYAGDDPDYVRGREEGIKARIAAGNAFAAEIGYEPLVLRALSRDGGRSPGDHTEDGTP